MGGFGGFFQGLGGFGGLGCQGLRGLGIEGLWGFGGCQAFRDLGVQDVGCDGLVPGCRQATQGLETLPSLGLKAKSSNIIEIQSPDKAFVKGFKTGQGSGFNINNSLNHNNQQHHDGNNNDTGNCKNLK